MGVSSWSTDPNRNAFADPDIPAMDGASARMFASFVRHLMAGVAQISTSTASIGHTPVYDADYTVIPTDVHVGMLGITAPRVFTLPDVDTYPLGQDLLIGDESGRCGPGLEITIQARASAGDTIMGQTAIQIADAYQSIRFRRGAANVWIIVR